MRLALRVARATVGLLMAAVVTGAVVLALGPLTGTYRAVPVLSDSMAPGMPVGSLAFQVPIPAGSVRVGDVITFRSPEEGTVVTHRVIAIEDTPSGRVLSTRGDNNPTDDPWDVRVTSDEVWRVERVVPSAGFVMIFLRGGRGGLLGASLLPAIAALWFIGWLWRPERPARDPAGDWPAPDPAAAVHGVLGVPGAAV